MRPVWHAFPNDPQALEIDEQFMLGPSFMVSPALNKNQTLVRAYFPGDLWYNYESGKVDSTSAGFKDIDCPIDCIPLHVRGGSILPTQVLTT